MYRVTLFSGNLVVRTYENIESYRYDYNGSPDSYKVLARIILIDDKSRAIIISENFNWIIEEV